MPDNDVIPEGEMPEEAEGAAPEDSDFPKTCQWTSERQALTHFASYSGATQSQQHIKPLHWYVACRLVIEGGFRPEEITPRPPFSFRKRRGKWELSYDPTRAAGGEATILGGLKTKNVDVVVEKPGLGPVLAVSCKGMTGAFRNLTNRMEETIGECTNLHITYPAMVFGYLFVIRANRLIEEAAAQAAESEDASAGRQLKANDIAMAVGGEPVESIIRFHSALRELTGRRGIRDDVSRYEAVSLAMVEMADADLGKLLPTYPAEDSPLRLEQFFQTLYLRYDERFVYSAPDLKSVTQRLEWAPESPALQPGLEFPDIDYPTRLVE
ncbi:hypothetical protein GOL45_30300 [Sinorhizobium medicae]|nr:hypothetical protein [Sinorhizobium meliloti]MDX1066445.1 hypothetical protein [Sinorhizobium medicae]